MSSIPNSNPAASESAAVPANPPVTPPATTHAAFPPAQVLSAEGLKVTLKRVGTVPRLLLLAAAVLMGLSFFTPQFFVSMSLRDEQIPEELRNMYYHSWLLFGWSTWWGIVSFVLTFFAGLALIGDLLLAEIKGLRFMLRLGYTAVFGLLTLTTGLGILLALFGTGLGVGSHYNPNMGPTLADYSVFRMPIMSVPLLLLTVVALGISGWMFVREMKLLPAAGKSGATAKPGGQVPAGNI